MMLISSCLMDIGRIIVRLLILLCLGASLIISPFLQPVFASKNPQNTLTLRAEKGNQYKAAKKYAYTLEHDSIAGGERKNWLTGVRNFRRIYLTDTKGVLAPPCLYMIARMYRRMYQRFHLPIDLEESLNYFLKVSSFFPDNKLADDALFAAAQLYKNRKNDLKTATKIYRKIVNNYTKGDRYNQALANLRELAQSGKISLPGSISTDSRQQAAKILPVKYWSSDDYTRVVVQASTSVHYSTRLLEKDGDQPRRLYIDFSQSYIPPKFRVPLPIEDGLLRRVRAGQFDSDTVRVVLDIESISDYKIFNLNDPFRVVVDVHGIKKIKPTATAHASTPIEKSKKTPEVRENKSTNIFVILADTKKWKPRQAYKKHGRKKDTAAPRLSLAQQLGLGIRKIIIDPGHGGKDPGAMAFGLKEKNIVLKVAKKMKAILGKKYNYEVTLTRNSDKFLPLEERTALANTAGADLFVSIHVNAHPDKSIRGIETFYLNLATNAEAMRVAARENATSTHNISDMQDILTDLMQNSKILESSRLAQFVQNNLVSGLRQDKYSVKDHGVKQAPFYVLIGAQMPAILSEISFITNQKEARLLQNEDYLEDIADQIAAGVAAYVSHHSTAAAQL
jgi:N-acetylmuramoyl-L-alanine amidase